MNNKTIFEAIKTFVDDIFSEYGAKHHPLKLYSRLINQTKLEEHNKAVEKHITAFFNFCSQNRDAIFEQDKNKLIQNKIQYSDKVFINMKKIFSLSDSETEPIIWQHLLTLSALVDPVSKAKEILKKNEDENKNAPNEANFMNDIISKVGENMKPGANPMEAIMSITQSGLFTDLLSGMQGGVQSGQLDLSKLMGIVQNMVSSLGNQIGDDPEAKNAMGLLNTMTGMVQNMNLQQPPSSDTKNE